MALHAVGYTTERNALHLAWAKDLWNTIMSVSDDIVGGLLLYKDCQAETQICVWSKQTLLFLKNKQIPVKNTRESSEITNRFEVVLFLYLILLKHLCSSPFTNTAPLPTGLHRIKPWENHCSRRRFLEKGMDMPCFWYLSPSFSWPGGCWSVAHSHCEWLRWAQGLLQWKRPWQV